MCSITSPYNPMSTGVQASIANGHPAQDPVSGLMVDGNYIDGSWELSISIEDLDEMVKVRVLGDLTLGELMHKIVEGVALQQSWSDHRIWWIDRNTWLLHNRTTLDQHGIQSDARLMFRRMHGHLQVVLPSMISTVVRVNYASKVYNVVCGICKDLNIRHPEELSLMIPINKEHLKYNLSLPTLRQGNRTGTMASPASRLKAVTMKNKQYKSSTPRSVTEFDRHTTSPYETLRSFADMTTRLHSDQSLNQDLTDFTRSTDCYSTRSAKTVFSEGWLMKPNNLIQKARLNSGWLDSSRSLMEHGIEPPRIKGETTAPPVLYLCFKYHVFYDLNLKYDAVRIHQLYEQARWSLLSGSLDCTEDEMVVFAAYQLQAQIHALPSRQQMSLERFGDVDTTPYYPTLGLANTIGGHRKSFAKQSPDLSRKQYMTLGSTGPNSSISRLPGPVPPLSCTSVLDTNSQWNSNDGGGVIDEVDELLVGLEQSCGVAEEPGSASRSLQPNARLFLAGTPLSSPCEYDVPDTAEIPCLQDNLRIYKGGSGWFQTHKVYWVVMRETRLYLFENENETQKPVRTYSLQDCTINPEVDASAQKYIIRLGAIIEPSHATDHMVFSNGPHTSSTSPTTGAQSTNRGELRLRCEAAEQFARWLAALHLAAKGKTLASRVAYEKEVNTIWENLQLQVPGPIRGVSKDASFECIGDLSDFCAERIIRKTRSKQKLRERIVKAQLQLCDLSALEAKYKYIQAWQRLPCFGRSYFTVAFHQSCKFVKSGNGGLFATPLDDLISVSPCGIEVVSPHTGAVLRTWGFGDLKSWDVNWESGNMVLTFRNDNLSFKPLCANCKTVTEFIGGYVCLNQRTLEGSQEFNERQFLRLTGSED